VIVACEVRFGAAKSGSRRLAKRLDQLLQEITQLPLEPPVARHYADIRAHLERRGTPIGPNDLFIAAHARALDAVLVTDNEREFSRVPRLSVENWRRS
jgi:tRNA(fMet)-specific endonuclease VapC